jgi:tRNA A-37 threonylcarbamoyl transferase component Bud32
MKRGRFIIPHGKTPQDSKHILDITARLKRAGVLVPHVELHGSSLVYERIGLKRKTFWKNDLTAFMTRYYETALKGNMPATSRLTRLLSSLAKSVASAHQAGIAHNGLSFRNIVVAKSRIGLSDHRNAEVVTVNWRNPDSVYSAFEEDYNILSNSFTEIAQTFEAPQIRRSLLRRRAWFFDRLLSQYPLSHNALAQLKKRINKNYAVWSETTPLGKVNL